MQKMVFFLLLTILKAGCDDDSPQDSQQDELRQIEALRNEIIGLTNSVSCTNAEEWAFAAIGAKACGGPTEYIAYPLTIDTQDFLQIIETYTNRQDAYNKKWGIGSDCSLVTQPKDVACVDGEAELVY